ncbi:diadenylate cyclase CdaA [Lawsonibacter sp. OA9]|uniref:diadenylate cyclase CdaA n=1 Tax=Lawsonibacter sp. OA9 TaxID=2914163 RepID=UPI001F056CE2|nr:diadenylate cyclase CdaA [Lawsonibacter sp. OA9]MCH1979812.1 diadenylate cyclase CdaA [Lawsonibacter sp. OA9]
MFQDITSLLQNELPIISTIRLFDLLDIAILSLIIYKLLWMLRKSSSGRVLRGILILLVAMWISSELPLTATSFMLNKVVEWGVLVLVVLFQPEIRRFLERMGSSRLGLNFSSNRATPMEIETAITQTTEAYADLSRDKVGALMVFERKNLLDDVIKTGTALDCGVSSELLKNIFWNKAPLHDGAVIVREGRIVGAGCMLPLSGNVNLSRDLGMRHRAGIGMSEHSDAVVVIVSEETGSISAAVGGMLKRHLAPETLERLLRNELLSESKEEEKSSQFPLLSQLFGGNRKEGDRS